MKKGHMYFCVSVKYYCYVVICKCVPKKVHFHFRIINYIVLDLNRTIFISEFFFVFLPWQNGLTLKVPFSREFGMASGGTRGQAHAAPSCPTLCQAALISCLKEILRRFSLKASDRKG